jgi:hypothetical protein
MLLFLSGLLACAPDPTYAKRDSAEDTALADTGANDTAPRDTADTDDDQDDDGFSPAEGDCDDDNIRVAPSREENPRDGLDNDCDGHVDEAFAGVFVAYANATGPSSIVQIDTIGRLKDTVPLQGDCSPLWLDVLGDGWVVNCGQQQIASVDPSGALTVLADLTESDYGAWGIAAGPSGEVYVATLDSLLRIGADGTPEELARWTVDFMDPAAHAFAASAVDVDWATGEVGLYDYFGGFATWTASAGFQVKKKGDFENPSLVTFSGSLKDGGGWYTVGQDAASGTPGVYLWEGSDWALQEAWTDEDWVPFMAAIEGATGDAYVTANAGWFYTVWRIVEGSGYAADLYVTDGTTANRSFYGIAIDQ